MDVRGTTVFNVPRGVGAVRVGDILVPPGVRRLLTASEQARTQAMADARQLREVRDVTAPGCVASNLST